MSHSLRFISLMWLVVCAGLTFADDNNSKVFGHYQVHYSVFNSDFLTPEVARQYQLTRSRSLGLINITVIDTNTNQAVSAGVTGNAYNLAGQNKSLVFREIKEQGAIYYIADFRFVNEERLHFKLNVSPDGIEDQFALDFKHTVYVTE
ncbi:MAG: DUF4426 domain-containing protein [Gammaproteobacteria bacterium]|nr:DUF4426 domain-containing protein [Gammaproteobacteria bacterium]NVK89252.1 DUF4426 domain-containing protein [Gammaproteobacteria bacterium]